jgi:Ti-type conjugative transfer relaxase TraA
MVYVVYQIKLFYSIFLFENFKVRAYTSLRDIANSQATYLTIFNKLVYNKIMANYHLTVKVFSRKCGRSCVSALAYRSATMLVDQRNGETYDYRNKENVEDVEIIFSNDASFLVKEISEECKTSRQSALQKLSEIFEAAEKRKDARVYREIEFSLPRELTKEQNIEWARTFIQDTCVARGMLAIMNYHFEIDEKTGEEKPHCHVLLSTRALTEGGFSTHKVRDWDRVELVEEWREQCAMYQNAALKEHGFDIRVDHRSYVDRDIDLEPQPKLGMAPNDKNQRVQKTDKRALFDAVRLKNQFKILKNPELVLSIVTSNHSTFTAKDIAKVLNRYIDDPEQFHNLYNRLKTSKELVRVDTYRQEEVFTTREMLRVEMGLVQRAENFAAQGTHPVDASYVESAIAAQNKRLETHGGLSSDQDKAIRHMLSSDQISCVVGFAGAGKTTSLEAAKKAWEQAGYKVIGLAPTGRAADNMARCGIRAMTVHKFLGAQEQGRERISPKSVVVLDEAGMVDSRRFVELLTIVEKAGAKIVPMGDANQLQAIEAGPAFRLLTNRVEPAILETIVRQQEGWQRDATRLFGSLNTRKALEIYQENGIFNTIDESAIKDRDALERFCLARQVSGRIWMEMQNDITTQKLEVEHPDVSLHQEWLKIYQEAAKDILMNIDQYAERLEERGVYVGHLRTLRYDYDKTTEPSQQQALIKRTENTLRPMSYDNLEDTRVETKHAMISAWAENREANLTQTHIMLAFTNRDATSLNEQARQMMREKGEVTGPEFTYKTCHLCHDDFGKEIKTYENKAFACGDRLLFTRNDNGLGVKNGTLGTIVKLDQNKITVKTDDAEKVVSFAPKLYPFIDSGWATTIHKTQGVSVDHVKMVASYEQYRNLTYVGMSRHRQTLEVFGSSLDFWREEKYIDRLSRIQEKLSGVDYLDAKEVQAQLKVDEKVLWSVQKLQQGLDLWNAVKVTAKEAITNFLYETVESKPAQVQYRSFDHSEEKRSSDLFTVREGLSDARAKFELENHEKYQAVCEFFHFQERYGRVPTDADKPAVNKMAEQLTKIAGELFEERAVKDHAIPPSAELSIQAYEEFSQRLQQEKPRGDTPESKAQMQQERQAQEQQEQLQRDQIVRRGLRM